MAQKLRPAHQRPSDEEDQEQDYPTGLHKALTHLKKGALHRALGVKQGQKIPAEKLRKAKTSKNAHIRHMAAFAQTLDGFDHSK